MGRVRATGFGLRVGSGYGKTQSEPDSLSFLCMKIRVMLFKNWKLLLVNTNQTPPYFELSVNLVKHMSHGPSCLYYRIKIQRVFFSPVLSFSLHMRCFFLLLFSVFTSASSFILYFSSFFLYFFISSHRCFLLSSSNWTQHSAHGAHSSHEVFVSQLLARSIAVLVALLVSHLFQSNRPLSGESI